MCDNILFKFETGEEDKNVSISTNRYGTIEDLLIRFFRLTNTLIDFKQIQFMNKSKILNKYLNKQIRQFFNSSVINTVIKVFDAGNILGGSNLDNH